MTGHRKILRDNIQGITDPGITRLARKGGVKRINGNVYPEIRGITKEFLENILRATTTFTEYRGAKTVNPRRFEKCRKKYGASYCLCW